MSIKKIVMAGSIMILGMGLAVADGFGQADRNPLQTRTRDKVQIRTMFIDENGDGICDLNRDHDNDGIPNGKDPDWKRPQDGTGYKNRNGNAAAKGNGPGWSNASFRGSLGSIGSGICDGTGPKGKIIRKGRG